MEIFIVIAIVYFMISWFIAGEFEEIASKKGYNEKKYFWFPFLFGIAGYLMVVALPIKEDTIEERAAYDPISATRPITDAKSFAGNFPLQHFSDEDRIKQCPNCGVCHDSEFKACPSCDHKYEG